MSILDQPCAGWTPDITCCPTWASYSPTVQAAATTVASKVLWAATGRRYGLCPMIVRPCGKWCSGSCGGNMYWSYGTWMPYIMDGVWRNCWCGDSMCCTCEPANQIYLPGPVDSITQVLVDGVVIDPATYRVDDQRWLVRTGAGNTWPACQDMNLPTSASGTLQVSYPKGTPVPTEMQLAAGIYACQYAKACTGGDCELPLYATSVIRADTQFTLPSPTELLSMGLTGIWSVDQAIMADNPYGLKSSGRVIWPNPKSRPRVQTSP